MHGVWVELREYRQRRNTEILRFAQNDLTFGVVWRGARSARWLSCLNCPTSRRILQRWRDAYWGRGWSGFGWLAHFCCGRRYLRWPVQTDGRLWRFGGLASELRKGWTGIFGWCCI